MSQDRTYVGRMIDPSDESFEYASQRAWPKHPAALIVGRAGGVQEAPMDIESIGIAIDDVCCPTQAQHDVILAEHDLAECLCDAGTRYEIVGRAEPLDLTVEEDAKVFAYYYLGGADHKKGAIEWVIECLLSLAECAEAESGQRLAAGGSDGSAAQELGDCMRILAHAVANLPANEQ